jgi:hypothetical protein
MQHPPLGTQQNPHESYKKLQKSQNMLQHGRPIFATFRKIFVTLNQHLQ